MSLITKGFGLTSVGINRPALADILKDIQDGFDNATGLTWRRDPRAIVSGQLAGVCAASMDELWGQLVAVNADFDPRTAGGVSLDGISALTDTLRNLPVASTGQVICVGTNGTNLFANDLVTSADTLSRYQLAANVQIVTGTARVALTPYNLYDVRTNSGNTYVCMVAGMSGAGAGPAGTGAWTFLEADGTVQWQFVGVGLGSVLALVAATVTGPVGGSAGTINTIGTPRAGWASAINFTDVAVGRLADNDEQLRVRRVSGLSGQGKGVVDAIRAAIMAITGTATATDCVVFENTGNTVDANGLAPHSVEVIITGPAGGSIDAIYAAALLQFVCAGITAGGTTTVVVSDSTGQAHNVSFTRPVAVNLFLQLQVGANAQSSVNVTGTGAGAPTNLQAYPSDGDARAKAAALVYGAGFRAGLDARASAVESAVWAGLVLGGPAVVIPGLLEVAAVMDTVPIVAQPRANIPISIRQIAVLSSANTSVKTTFETP